MHIYVGKLTIIGSDNGLLPGRHQAIIWTNATILLIGPLGTNFGEILIEDWRPSKIGMARVNNYIRAGYNETIWLGHAPIPNKLFQ